MTRDELRSALAHPNTQAFLRVIREGETNQTDAAYRMTFGGGSFASFDDHPRMAFQSPWGWTSAAGAYQFMAAVDGKVKTDTWDRIAKKYGFNDFTPATQDEAAVALIHERGALQDLLRGDLSEVLDKVSYEWASLPPGRYGQPTLDAKRVYATYDKWLKPSDVAAAEPITAPEPEKSMPFPMTLVYAAAEALLPLVSDLFRGHGSKTAVRNADILEKAGPAIVEIAKTVSGQSGMAEAVTAVLDSPETSAAFRKAVEADLDRLVGMIERITKMEDDSRDKAAARTEKDRVDLAPRLASEQFWIVAAVGVAILCVAIFDLYDDGKMSEGILAMFAGYVGWAMQKRSSIIDYRFGSSASSQLKDEVIASARK